SKRRKTRFRSTKCQSSSKKRKARNADVAGQFPSMSANRKHTLSFARVVRKSLKSNTPKLERSESRLSGFRTFFFFRPLCVKMNRLMNDGGNTSDLLWDCSTYYRVGSMDQMAGRQKYGARGTDSSARTVSGMAFPPQSRRGVGDAGRADVAVCHHHRRGDRGDSLLFPQACRRAAAVSIGADGAFGRRNR